MTVMRKDLQLEVLSDPALLASVRGLMRAYLAGQGYGKDQAQEVVLAVDEACANAIRHSYEGRPDGTVSLELRSNEAWTEVCLEDSGIPAPPERLARKELTPPTVESATPGGLGVQLMYQVFDEVRFQPGEKRGNCVIMRLKRPQRKED
jgi:serine/threonine-protein kinase RsbW